MSALDNITEEILKQADDQADEIINKATVKVSELQKDVKEKQDELLNEAKNMAENEHKKIISHSQSSDRQNRKQKLLSIKRKVIKDIVAESKNQIEKFPTKEYFDLLLMLFEKNALKDQDGDIYFSKNDLKRLPKDFIKRCNEKLSEASIRLAGESENINNGFLIIYGKIEINCSIDSIFESNSQLLEDKAAVFLQ